MSLEKSELLAKDLEKLSGKMEQACFVKMIQTKFWITASIKNELPSNFSHMKICWQPMELMGYT